MSPWRVLLLLLFAVSSVVRGLGCCRRRQSLFVVLVPSPSSSLAAGADDGVASCAV